jgi:23S rRNA (uracil1939-C5)-methyltransferase
VKRVTGVELNKAAIKDAISNAKQNNISNVRFVAEDASKYMTALARTGEKVDAVIMDPPRSGSTKEFVDAVSRLAAEKIIYISCNPESLARDLLWFKQKNYKVKLIQPVDMFPFTSHIECVCLLSKVRK